MSCSIVTKLQSRVVFWSPLKKQKLRLARAETLLDRTSEPKHTKAVPEQSNFTRRKDLQRARFMAGNQQ